MPADIKQEFARLVEHLNQELASIRTGRANPMLIENTLVPAYNTNLPLVQLASITSPDAKILIVQPWDKSLLKDIEKALRQSNLGLTPQNDGTSIRLTIPPLTEERRREYLKILKQKIELGKVSLRQTREEHLRAMRHAKQQGKLSEDNFYAQQKELQKLTDNFMDQIATMEQKKEQEIMTV